MSYKVDLTLPFPPSVNGYYRAIKRGNICTNILSKKGREYKDIVASLVTPQLTEERLMVKVYLYPPDKRRRDIDNYNKALLDSLSGIIWKDDSQIDYLIITRQDPSKGGKTIIKIRGM